MDKLKQLGEPSMADLLGLNNVASDYQYKPQIYVRFDFLANTTLFSSDQGLLHVECCLVL